MECDCLIGLRESWIHLYIYIYILPFNCHFNMVYLYIYYYSFFNQPAILKFQNFILGDRMLWIDILYFCSWLDAYRRMLCANPESGIILFQACHIYALAKIRESSRYTFCLYRRNYYKFSIFIRIILI